ncbi:MAG: hypothetical protein ACO38W_12920, partial [Phycisphaerales bacterium]
MGLADAALAVQEEHSVGGVVGIRDPASRVEGQSVAVSHDEIVEPSPSIRRMRAIGGPGASRL